MGMLTLVDGTSITGYMPSNQAGYSGKLLYFLPPLSIDAQLRHPHHLKIAQIKQLAVHGRLYETVQHQGKNTDVLALHLLEGSIALAMYAEPRVIPLPMPPILSLALPNGGLKLSDKDHWYLSRNGVCTEMPRAHFAELMSAYLFDNPELAGKVARQEPAYLHANTPAIIAEYNRAKTSGQ